MDPRVLLLFVVAGLIIALLYLRYKNVELRHKERMTALEKGAQLPVLAEPAPPGPTRVYLLRGLIWLFSGIGLTIFLLAVASVAKTQERNRWDELESKHWRIARLRAQGVPEEELKQLMNEMAKENPPQPQPKDARVLAVAGLIPIGVGLAYLVFYSSEEKRLRGLPPAPAAREPDAGGPAA